MSHQSPPTHPQDAPAMGERRARWGYGYQDKVATHRILTILREELREGTTDFEGVRLADLEAGRVDDFVLIRTTSVEGNSIKWSRDPDPLNWGELTGAAGVLLGLADGYQRLCQRWPDKVASVRFQTNRPSSIDTHHAQLISTISVSEFLQRHWVSGPTDTDSIDIKEVWTKIAHHVRLSGSAFTTFVSACHLDFAHPEPPGTVDNSVDGRRYKQQFDGLHKALATWLTNAPDDELVTRDFLLSAIGARSHRSGLIQRFPEPVIPYQKNQVAALRLKDLIEHIPGGYITVVGPAGVGKSTLVQDTLTEAIFPFFVPYYAFLPSTDGNRDRAEALTFFQDVIERLDRFSPTRQSIGILDVVQGREALRRHMIVANERYVLLGHKTILLIDGLDHVLREVSLQASVLPELPPPREVPDGFVIILSGQPQAFAPSAIPASVAAAAQNEARRVQVSGLARHEVHEIISRVRKPTTTLQRDELHTACLGNPLVLTYLLSQLDRTKDTTIEEAIERAGHYGGFMDEYYSERLLLPLQDSATRRLLALLCRAAPTIPVTWLRTWPESVLLEDLYLRVLAPFLRIEDDVVRFIHDSLIAFLRLATRSSLPASDAVAEDRELYSTLADRSTNRPCSERIGRMRITHLLRAERHRDLLEQLSSDWLREAMHAFVPYAHLRPLILSGFSSACATHSWGHLLRLVLLDFELGQRTARIEASTLAAALLELDEPALALSEIRCDGRLLVEEQEALLFAANLWHYAEDHARAALKGTARALYLQAKPLALIYHTEPSNDAPYHRHAELLDVWSEVAPLFEPDSTLVPEIQKLSFTNGDGPHAIVPAVAKARLLLNALGTALDLGRDTAEFQEIWDAINALPSGLSQFLALLRVTEVLPAAAPVEAVKSAYASAAKDRDTELEYAWYLFRQEYFRDASDVVRRLQHIRVDPFRHGDNGSSHDIAYTVQLRWLQEALSIPQGAIPEVEEPEKEGHGRVEATARRLGLLRAQASAPLTIQQCAAAFRSLLLFHNQPVRFARLKRHEDYIVESSKTAIYEQIASLAQAMGANAIEALSQVVLELVDGPAGKQFAPNHRRYFASTLFEQGGISREAATELGLSSVADVQDDDPAQRQQACLDIAKLLHLLGDDTAARHWMRRASDVSAGAGSHKDYHMVHIAEWLTRSMTAESADLGLLDKFARAVEVAGGRGGNAAAAKQLRLLQRLEPARASQLATECIDRGVLSVADALGTLITGGAAAGGTKELLTAVYVELCSLIAAEDTSETALAVLHACPRERKVETATLLMSFVRTNALPSHRVEVARALEDALRQEGLGELMLAQGLLPGQHDSSQKSTLYRLSTGEAETVSRVAARLSAHAEPGAWNPNPSENTEFDWWSAIKSSNVKASSHLDALIAAFPPPDYRQVELFALRAERALEFGDRNAARQLAELAIERAKNASWHSSADGAQKLIAFSALKRLDHAEWLARARAQFCDDLSAGKLLSAFLLSDVVDVFEALKIPWPNDAALCAIRGYVEQVLTGNQDVPPYRSFDGLAATMSVDEAICEFIAELVTFPMPDVAVAARRVLARYCMSGGHGFTSLLTNRRSWLPAQLEHLLAAVHVGSKNRKAGVESMRAWVEGLNVIESAGVRSIAKRICDDMQWHWTEIRDQAAAPVILLPRGSHVGREARLLLGGDSSIAFELHRRVFIALERAGIESGELGSEFERAYLLLKNEYPWANGDRLERWLKQLLTTARVAPPVVVGREAALRVLGRRSLSGQVSPSVEAAYDSLYPIYDPSLELWPPAERPAELRAMDWLVTDDDRDAWLLGARAKEWSDYPESAQGLHIIGERTWFIRPEWHWPREERYRGLIVSPLDQNAERRAIELPRGITYETYLSGGGQDGRQLIVLNRESQLAGAAYQWAAINSNFARALGWHPSDDAPFEWLDSRGNVAVKSVFWKDGWVWLEPPRFESLGEGWCVLATEAALNAIRVVAPDTEIHLWVERHSHGSKPYNGMWHLSKAW